jgi:hypothetical protein
VRSYDSIFVQDLSPTDKEPSDLDASTDLKDVVDEKQNIFVNLSDRFPKFDPAYAAPANDYDRIAKQLAGLHIPDNKLNNQANIDYAKFIAQEWQNLNGVSLSKIPEWSKNNIAARVGNSTTLFYPFGGPDAAYALKFFPQMRTYILVGLEPIGNFENIKRNIENESTMLSLKRAFSSYLKKGYFVTSEMATQLYNKNVRGVLYLILIELAQSGFVIDLVENLSIDSKGNEVARQSGMVDCIKILFTPIAGGEQKSMYYARADLCNSNKQLTNLLNFVRRFSFTTFIKSASYVLHDKSASQTKNFILENANAILQDDTGIPFNNFDSNWDKYIFGQYTRPTLPVFRNYRQQALSNYYEIHKPVEIGFKIGYGFNQDRPNLILLIPTRRGAIKQTTSMAEESGGCPCRNSKNRPTT